MRAGNANRMIKQKEVHPYGREKLITHELELQISYDFYVYASAYTAKVFYDLENTLLRNGEKYIQQKSILHSDNGGLWSKKLALLQQI